MLMYSFLIFFALLFLFFLPPFVMLMSPLLVTAVLSYLLDKEAESYAKELPFPRFVQREFVVRSSLGCRVSARERCNLVYLKKAEDL